MTSRAQIEETLIQWARNNLPSVVAPAVLIIEDPELDIGRVAITIRVGGKLPSPDGSGRGLSPPSNELPSRFEEEKPLTPAASRREPEAE